MKPAAVNLPWATGPWIRVVDLSGDTLPLTSRRRQAEALVRVLCPAEASAPDEPTKLSETDAQRRARLAAQAAAGWT